MIEHPAQLKVTQAQIQRLEEALAELRRTATLTEFGLHAKSGSEWNGIKLSRNLCIDKYLHEF